MNIKEIKRIHTKAKSEAQRAIHKVYKKYQKELVKAIAEQVPKGLELGNINGLNRLIKDGEMIEDSGATAWTRDAETSRGFGYVALLQYADELEGYFDIPMHIKGRKKVKK